MRLTGEKAMVLGLGVAVLMASVWTTVQAEPKPADDAALKRAKWETEMLDNLYKNAIVLITTHYVTEETDLPAGSAFKALFATMKDNGYHEVRLLDGLGEPINDENLPQDDFEKAGIEAMLAGKPIYEKIENRDGQRVLRTITPLPMVMAKCVLCHDNYEGQKIVGGLGYAVPIDLK